MRVISPLSAPFPPLMPARISRNRPRNLSIEASGSCWITVNPVMRAFSKANGPDSTRRDAIVVLITVVAGPEPSNYCARLKRRNSNRRVCRRPPRLSRPSREPREKMRADKMALQAAERLSWLGWLHPAAASYASRATADGRTRITF